MHEAAPSGASEHLPPPAALFGPLAAGGGAGTPPYSGEAARIHFCLSECVDASVTRCLILFYALLFVIYSFFQFFLFLIFFVSLFYVLSFLYTFFLFSPALF